MRILFLGNIANNAYLNAKLLREAGVEVDLICSETHPMSFPEWEDAAIGEQDNTIQWFAKGPFGVCADYLLAQRSGGPPQKKEKAARALSLWKNQQADHQKKSFARWQVLYKKASLFYPLLRRSPGSMVLLMFPVLVLLLAGPLPVLAGLCVALLFFLFARESLKSFICMLLWRAGSLPEYNTIRKLSAVRYSDLAPYLPMLPHLKTLFSQYDLVVGYATTGVLPLLAGKRPYCAYEHGTIRNIPFQPDRQGRLCAATYQQADTCFITNGDNQQAAERLGLKPYLFVPHPVNEEHVVDDSSQILRDELLDKLNADFLVFHPARHHWSPERHPDWEKGNDFLIRGLAQFIKTERPRAAAVFVDWGQTVEQSKALLQELGIHDHILWVAPQPNRQMVTYIGACDLVADQFFLGAFGSITPKALLHRRPVMVHLDEEKHRWCFPEMPPVLKASSPEEVHAGLTALVKTPGMADRLAQEGHRWYDRYHSNRVIVKILLGTFHELLTPTAHAHSE